MGAPNLRPMPGPGNTFFTNRLVARRKAAIAYAKRVKAVNAAKREANRALVAAAPAPRLDATPVRLPSKPSKPPHLRRRCDEEDE